jgi:hypothetical protein
MSTPSKWIVPSCVFEPGAASAVELILPARGPSKLWNPYPGSPERSLVRRKIVSRHDHTDPPTGGGAIHYKSHPTPSPITRRVVCTVRVQRNMVRLTMGP